MYMGIYLILKVIKEAGIRYRMGVSSERKESKSSSIYRISKFTKNSEITMGLHFIGTLSACFSPSVKKESSQVMVHSTNEMYSAQHP